MRPRNLLEATQGHQIRNGATRARPGGHRKTTESDQKPPEASKASQEPPNAARKPQEGVLVATKTRLSRERCCEKADPSRRHGGPPEATRKPLEGHFKATGGAQRPPKAARSHVRLLRWPMYFFTCIRTGMPVFYCKYLLRLIFFSYTHYSTALLCGLCGVVVRTHDLESEGAGF